MNQACIYTVANKASQCEYSNLIHSIRSSGCTLDIVLIPFGGKPIDNYNILSQVKVIPLESFPPEGIDLLMSMGKVLRCPSGFLRRFLAFYGPYEKFIYTDNDIVALTNWQIFIDQLHSYDLVHADKEYTTRSRYNFKTPCCIESSFGIQAHNAAITAGHFAARKSSDFIASLYLALTWISENSAHCFLHDQTLIQLALLISSINCLNLCKPPHNWLSSWSGDYHNTLHLIQQIQQGKPISHIHFSGGPIGAFEQPIDELLLAHLSPHQRLVKQTICGTKSLCGWNKSHRFYKRLKRRLF
jgi:hypothetical protein